MSDEIKPKHPGGRPTHYNKQMGEMICRIVATNPYGLKKLTRMFPELPNESTINEWRLDHHEFAVEYVKAKLIQADLLAEECLDISDDSENDFYENDEGLFKARNELVNRSRLRVDTRKWLSAKLLPKQYGDFKHFEDMKDQNEEMKEELIKLRTQLEMQNKKDY